MPVTKFGDGPGMIQIDGVEYEVSNVTMHLTLDGQGSDLTPGHIHTQEKAILARDLPVLDWWLEIYTSIPLTVLDDDDDHAARFYDEVRRGWQEGRIIKMSADLNNATLVADVVLDGILIYKVNGLGKLTPEWDTDVAGIARPGQGPDEWDQLEIEGGE